MLALKNVYGAIIIGAWCAQEVIRCILGNVIKEIVLKDSLETVKLINALNAFSLVEHAYQKINVYDVKGVMFFSKDNA